MDSDERLKTEKKKRKDKILQNRKDKRMKRQKKYG